MAISVSASIYNKSKATAQYFDESLGDGLALTMTIIPGGTFMMGSPQEESGRFKREGPQHQVSIPSFCMGRFPVTQVQWRYVAKNLPREELELNPTSTRGAKGDMRPVEWVNWFEANEFCARLATLTGRDYRLPSEAEWEYACRAGTTTPFHFCQTIEPSLANYDSTYTYNGGQRRARYGGTTRVNHFKHTNAFGLCAMHGNLLEWCMDQYHDSYRNASDDGSPWVDEPSDEDKSRILRGGSWYNHPRNCRSAYRIFDHPRTPITTTGFRVACMAPPLELLPRTSPNMTGSVSRHP